MPVFHQRIYQSTVWSRTATLPRVAVPAIIVVAEQNPTDGYRLITAWVCHKLGRQINRKRVLRVMRERKLIQRRTHEPRLLGPAGWLVPYMAW